MRHREETIAPSAAIVRLGLLAPLTGQEVRALELTELGSQRFLPSREIVVEGTPVRDASIILLGWACRVRHFMDGRRQILGFLLPGDLIGICRQREPVAVTTVAALSEVVICPAPHAEPGKGGLAEAYAVSAALEEAYLFRQIARLGRLNAYERIVDWLLETRDRLKLAGLECEGSFPMPLTQEVLADTLGLTSVHVNRTLQTLRRDQRIEWRNGTVRLVDPEGLAALIDYRSVLVTGASRL